MASGGQTETLSNQKVSHIHEMKVNFKCKICDYTTKIETALKTHITSVHDGNSIP